MEFEPPEIASGGSPGDLSSTDSGDALIPGDKQMPTITSFRGILPNPFIGSTTVALDLAKELTVHVNVYSLRGALVRSLASGVRPAGRHRIIWDGRDDHGSRLVPGVYLIRVVGGNLKSVRKAVVLE